MSEPTLIAFTGGGTGGHIYPGLAVAERLRSEGFTGRMVWLGSKKESDRKAVEQAGLEYLALPSGKLRRHLSWENLTDAFRVLGGYFAARKALKSLKPVLLFSKGGYVSVPPAAAAAGLKIPVFTHESDLSPGLATRLNAKNAERILVAYKETVTHFPEALRSRCLVAGNPIRKSLLAGNPEKGRELLGISADTPLLFFLGGSQGARQVNELVEACLGELCALGFVLHQTGEDGRGAILGDSSLAQRYRSFAFIREELPHYLAAADIVIGRSGAGTLWEAGALGKPMILIPLAGAGTRGDQVENAELFEAAGAAKVLLGKSARPECLLEEIKGFLASPEKRAAAGTAARDIAGLDGTGIIAKLILDRIGAAG